jgi:adenylate cyclase
MWAMMHYKEKSFWDARDIFEKLASDGDAPSKAYVERCDFYIKNPPDKDWDGVWRMMEK